MTPVEFELARQYIAERRCEAAAIRQLDAINRSERSVLCWRIRNSFARVSALGRPLQQWDQVILNRISTAGRIRMT